VKRELKKFVLLGLVLVVAAMALPFLHVLPVPVFPMQFKVTSTALSTAGGVCRFSALYFDAGFSVLTGMAGGFTGGAAGGVGWLGNGVATNQWGPANPYNCPP